MNAEQSSRNKRTAAILFSIALVFFVGIIAAQALGTPAVSAGVMGAAVLLFLVFAIGRNLRRGKSGSADNRTPTTSR